MLSRLPRPSHPDLLVGFETNDDAGVFRLSPDVALVQTVDFFTPMVDAPYAFGQIAVANAVSDLYAMGARPLTGLNIVGFPVGDVPTEILSEILRGGADKATEAGVVVLGGHTVDDAEPKFGMAVTGLVHPGRVVTNSGGKPGDRLVLTKPLGVGIISTALKRDLAPADLVARAIATMAELNRAASEAMVEIGVHAATDVTGFGLLGHLLEMMRGSGTGARIEASRVPVFPEAVDLARQDVIPGGTRQNLSHVQPVLVPAPELDPGLLAVLADAQTSGGLLMAVPPGRLEALLSALSSRGVTGHAIGELTEGDRLVVRS